MASSSNQPFSIPVRPKTPALRQHINDDKIGHVAGASPSSNERYKKLKRKASDALLSPAPVKAAACIFFQLECIDAYLASAEARVKCLLESKHSTTSQANKDMLSVLVKETRQHIRKMQDEKAALFLQGHEIVQDLEDEADTKPADAYLDMIYDKTRHATATQQRADSPPPNKKLRAEMKKIAQDFYDTALRDKHGKVITGSQGYCQVLGRWLAPGEIKNAHIVPYSFGGKDLDYLFGPDSDALANPRNCLSLAPEIEKRFDKQQLTIVPVDVSTTPVEYKVVIVDKEILNDLVRGNEHPNLTFKVSTPSAHS